MNAEEFINNLLGDTIDQIVNGRSRLPADQQAQLKSDVPFTDSNFFTWCTPGIPVESEDFAFLRGLRKPIDSAEWKDLSDADKATRRGDETYALTVAMDNFSTLVDTVPAKDGAVNSIQVWEPQNRISHIYEAALRDSEVADSVESPEAQARIDAIRAQTVETVTQTDADTHETFTEERPSRLVMAYNKYAAEYMTALDAYITLMSKAVDGSAADVQRASMLGPAKYDEVSAAYDMWTSQGHKLEYEKMMADLAQLEGVSMSLLKKDYLTTFERSRRVSLIDGGEYSVARLVPGGFYESGGWTAYSFSSSSLQTVDTNKTQKYSGGARYGFGIGARGSYQKLDSASSIDFEGTTMSFELTQVPIVRAWFREDFLISTQWRPKGATTGAAAQSADLLSNGQPDSPDGKLFAYPTVVIFARNIKVTKSSYEKLSTEASKSAGGDSAFNFGPFSLGAKADYNTTEKTMKVTEDGESIVVTGMQIIGFRNHILPLSPNPDPSIAKWI